MKAVFVEELGRLAADCNVALARREGQVKAWAERWGGEDDTAIREAFRSLREPGAMRGSWPTFGEMVVAMDKGRSYVRRREPQGVGPRDHRGETAPRNDPLAGRFAVCVLFAAANRDMPPADLERWMGRFLSSEFSDAEISEYRRQLTRERRPEAHSGREIRAFLAEHRQVSDSVV